MPGVQPEPPPKQPTSVVQLTTSVCVRTRRHGSACGPADGVRCVQKAGDRGSLARTSGGYAIVVAHNPDAGVSRIKLPSGSKKVPSAPCRAVQAALRQCRPTPARAPLRARGGCTCARPGGEHRVVDAARPPARHAQPAGSAWAAQRARTSPGQLC